MVMIDSTAELMAALNKAKGGEVLTLAPGTYPGVTIRGMHKAPAVVITGKGAVLPGLKVDKSSGLVFRRLEFAVPSPGQFAYLVSSSNNITFDGLSVHGPLGGSPQGKASGISILKSSNIKVLNSEFQQLRRGVGVGSSQDVVISGNSFHDLQTDGIMAAQVTNIQIVKNNFFSFFPIKGDHPDAIQFLTAGTSQASRDILISDNTALRGNGSAMQGVFMRDEKQMYPYENVRILNNLLIGTGYNGIAITGGRGIEISGNELLSYEGKTNLNWVLVRQANGVVVQNNKALKIGYENVTGLKESGNKTNKPVRDGGAAVLAARNKAAPP